MHGYSMYYLKMISSPHVHNIYLPNNNVNTSCIYYKKQIKLVKWIGFNIANDQ